MAVYYKFKSAKDYDSLSIEGHFIAVGILKERIFEKKNLGRGSDFDLVISNAQTNEEYNDEATLVSKNTSVLVRRVPGRPRMAIVTEGRSEKTFTQNSTDSFPSLKPELETSDVPQLKQPEESDWADEFGMDLYTMPDELHQHQLVVVNKSEEDDKIKAFVDASASDWQRQTQESIPSGRGFGRGSHARGAIGRGFGCGFEKRTPPQGYICHRCRVPGHYIQHCPTNGDPSFDMKRMKPPTGIPKSMLVPNPDGFYALPSGGVAVLRPNEAVFHKEIEGPALNKAGGQIPIELCCLLCRGVLKDAVLTSKCCFKSYCDKCIRDQIISGSCVCGATNVLADDLLPNKTLRDAINRLLEAATATGSAENAGSMNKVQDMESTRCPQLKELSPSASAEQRDAITKMPLSQSLNGTELAVENNVSQQLLVKGIPHKRRESFEKAPESVSMPESFSQEDALALLSTPQVEGEVRQHTFLEAAKKKKMKSKRQHLIYGEKEIQWSGAACEFPVDSSLLLHGGNPALYSGYWSGPQWLGDGCLPYPYANYGGPGPVSFEMQYGGAMLAHKPFTHTAFMPPVTSFPRGSLNSGSSIMSREEFEARKADLKRKRKSEQRASTREQAQDFGNGDLSSIKMKRSNLASSLARSPEVVISEVADDMERNLDVKASGNFSSYPLIGRRGQERKENTLSREHQMIDITFEQASKDTGDSQVLQRETEASGRPEKLPKVSVFSRIRFPNKPKRSTTQKPLDNIDSEGDGYMCSAGLRNRRVLKTH